MKIQHLGVTSLQNLWLQILFFTATRSGYPLQSPEEKSGGFSLLSLTRINGYDN
jgi:hypothetical protein